MTNVYNNTDEQTKPDDKNKPRPVKENDPQQNETPRKG